MSDDDPPTEPVRFTIVVHAGWSVDPPELWELVFPRCSFAAGPSAARASGSGRPSTMRIATRGSSHGDRTPRLQS